MITDVSPLSAPVRRTADGSEPASLRRGTCFILHNAASGAHDVSAALDGVTGTLAAAAVPFQFVPIERPRHIEALAEQLAARAIACDGTVVAAGGDGTINAVVRGILGTGCRFGVLPMGTFNYFARNHGIPTDIVAASRVLVDGEVRPVQVGTVNDRVFLVNASLGLYPRLLEQRELAKRHFGRSRLVALASAAFFLLRQHRQLRLRIHCDGLTDDVETSTLFVGNNRLQLEQIGLVEAACVDRGLLAALYLKPITSAGLMGLALRGSLGLIGEDENITSFACREMTVTLCARRKRVGRIKVATDGETSRLQLPLRFGIARSLLPLLCPRGTAG